MAQILLPSFPNLSIRLDRLNFIYWQSQILANVTTHGFDAFLHGDESCIPTEFVDTDDGTQCRSIEFTEWIRKDQLLKSWLLSSISESMLGFVSRFTHSFEIWRTLDQLFRSQSKAHALNLRFQLQTLKKGDLLIADSIMQMQNLTDQLRAAGQSVSDDELILYILGGLGSDFESVIVNLTSRCDDLTIAEVQFVLQTHEMRLSQQQ